MSNVPPCKSCGNTSFGSYGIRVAENRRYRRLFCKICGKKEKQWLDETEETRLIDADPIQQARVEEILKTAGYDPALWTLVWAHLKDEQGQKHTFLLKNPKRTAEEKQEKEEFLAAIKKTAPTYKPIKYQKVSDPHMKLIDIADLHIAKYAIARNGSVSYDIQTATTRATTAVESMLTRTQGFPTEVFWLPIGNDVLHIDNKLNTTTKGTKMDSTGLWWQALRAAKTMYIEVIDRLSSIAPVEVIYNSSNHDEHLGFSLAEILDAYYTNNKNVTFTIEPQNDRIYKQYGQNLVGFDHGDGARDTSLPLLMACEEPKLWAECPNRYLIRHHLHHWSKREFLAGKDMPGVTLQYMRSPSATDHFHQKMGYVGVPQAIDSFVFHKTDGQVTHTSCVFAR